MRTKKLRALDLNPIPYIIHKNKLVKSFFILKYKALTRN